MNNTFLKWAGGKNWFVRNHKDILPSNYKCYIDPFVGGGSLLFFLEPQKAIINDINVELTTTYQALKDDYKQVEKALIEHSKKHDREYYYKVRKMAPRKEHTIAARMIYLNRTCFNGIYRVNSVGGFNVPIGSQNTVIKERDDFKGWSNVLQCTKIFSGDFESIIDLAQEEDFLFCDPPYAVIEETRFVGYTKNEFDWDDQIRLQNALIRAKNRKVQIIMTNVNHPEVRKLYEVEKGFELKEVSRYCGISGRNSGRFKYSELIVSANVKRG